MNIFVWIVVLLVLGLVTGRVVGALTAFTRGPAVYDLLAGGLGALIGGALLRLIGPVGLRDPLPALLIGIGAAFLATWLTRIATWPADAPLPRPDDLLAEGGPARQRHELMTTAEGSRLLLRHGHLLLPPLKGAESESTV